MDTEYTARLASVYRLSFDAEGRSRFFDTVEVSDKNSGVVIAQFLVETSDDTETYNVALDAVVGSHNVEWID